MKKRVLIIDDDQAIREVLEDRMESAGFDFDSAGSQTEAVDHLRKRRYDLILLDLELPSRSGKPTSTQVGRNLLDQIREDERNESTPVIVITAHGGDRPDTAVSLMAQGANYFVHKLSLDQLEDSIKTVLSPKPKARRTAAGEAKPNESKPFEGGDLEFHENGVSLNGVPLAGPTSTICRVLEILSEVSAESGRRLAYTGKVLADRLGLERGQLAIVEAVSGFRMKVTQELKKAGIGADDEAVIMRGKGGYELAPGIRSAKRAALARPPAAEITPEERQRWFLEQVEKRKMTRAEFESHFNISESTSKRDLRALEPKVEFVGTGKKGYYRLKRRSVRPQPD